MISSSVFQELKRQNPDYTVYQLVENEMALRKKVDGSGYVEARYYFNRGQNRVHVLWGAYDSPAEYQAHKEQILLLRQIANSAK
jgi:hypothetical protein